MLRPKILTTTGDTIVEVLIVIVVIGSVLASAYSIAVRSLQDTQRTQEHAYALKVAEGQLENLKAALATGSHNALLTASNGFCLNDATFNGTDIGNSPTASLPDTYTNYGNCKKDPNGASCATYCYYYGIRRMDPVNQPNTFTSSVRWDGVGGVPSQVQLTYKAYK